MSDNFDGILTNDLIERLAVIAASVADKARDNASWSSTIPNAIFISDVRLSQKGTFSIDLGLNLKLAPQARAFEFGSGLHNPKNPAKYPILPKPDNISGLLYFWWENPTWGDPADWYAFPRVMHPGVQARPFIRPAVASKREEIRKELGKAFKGAYRKVYGRVTVIEAK